MLEPILLRPRGNEALNCRLGSLNILKKTRQPSEVYKKKAMWISFENKSTVFGWKQLRFLHEESGLDKGSTEFTQQPPTYFEDASKYRVIWSIDIIYIYINKYICIYIYVWRLTDPDGSCQIKWSTPTYNLYNLCPFIATWILEISWKSVRLRLSSHQTRIWVFPAMVDEVQLFHYRKCMEWS